MSRRAYDTDEILIEASGRGMGVHIPPKSNRRKKKVIDLYLYK